MTCNAVGVEIHSARGPFAQKAKILADAKIAVYAKLLGTLQLDASAWCPEGGRCEGVVAIVSGPFVADFRTTVNGQDTYTCLVTLSGAFDGECSEATRPAGTDEEDSDTCISARDFRTFMAKVMRLPEKPAEPKGACRLYRDKIGHAFPYPICAGSCERGECKTYVSVKGEKITAKCECG